MALFGKGAPPLTLLRRAQDRLRSFETARPHRASSGGHAGLLRVSGQRPVPWTPIDDEQDEEGNEEEDQNEG